MKSRLDLRDSDLGTPPFVLFERRSRPDRRSQWRGGRRDSDWLNRPLGALSRLERAQRGQLWRLWAKP